MDPRKDIEQETNAGETENQAFEEDDFPHDDEVELRARRFRFVMAMVVLGLAMAAIAYREAGHRHLSALKAELRPQSPGTQTGPPRPGGQDPLSITRSALPGSLLPEFLSATVLPGRGMNVFQITAYIPGEGEVSLLASPSIDEAGKRMTGAQEDANGQVSVELGGAFLAPWADSITGNSDNKSVATTWERHNLLLPGTRASHGGMLAANGLLLLRGADAVDTDVLPDGGVVTASFNAGDFGAHWPSQTTMSVNILLSARVMDLTFTARNTGTEPEPMGLGWRPWFALSGDRSQAHLHLPSSVRVEESGTNLPSGRVVPVERTAYDFTARGGVALGNRDVDASFTHLRAAALDNGPVIELIQPDRGYGLRLTPLTSTIKTLHVMAPANKNMIALQPSFNVNDPFGHEWAADEDTGMVTLLPGQTTAWKLRLELFTLTSPSKPAL